MPTPSEVDRSQRREYKGMKPSSHSRGVQRWRAIFQAGKMRAYRQANFANKKGRPASLEATLANPRGDYGTSTSRDTCSLEGGSPGDSRGSLRSARGRAGVRRMLRAREGEGDPQGG